MKKGFTLIELLAVIVILAIIALIATPIILGIINDAREKANERSVELYASAVRNGIAAYQLREGKEVEAKTYTKDTLPFEVEYDGKVDCTNIIISDNGKVSLDKCTVNGGTKEYSYGIEEETPVAKNCTIEQQDESKYSVGDVVTCTFEESTEQFYVIENEDEDITEGIDMLAMYNLNVGDNAYTDGILGIQNENVIGGCKGYGGVFFSTLNYWSSTVNDYPAYVYGNQAEIIYPYVNEYRDYLQENGVSVANAKLISYEQLEYLGCYDDSTVAGSNCKSAPSWIYSTDYWTGSAYDELTIMPVSTNGYILYDYFDMYAPEAGDSCEGLRPVITISTNELK